MKQNHERYRELIKSDPMNWSGKVRQMFHRSVISLWVTLSTLKSYKWYQLSSKCIPLATSCHGNFSFLFDDQSYKDFEWNKIFGNHERDVFPCWWWPEKSFDIHGLYLWWFCSCISCSIQRNAWFQFANESNSNGFRFFGLDSRVPKLCRSPGGDKTQVWNPLQAGFYTSTDLLDFHPFLGGWYLFYHKLIFDFLLMTVTTVILENSFRENKELFERKKQLKRISRKRFRSKMATRKRKSKFTTFISINNWFYY